MSKTTEVTIDPQKCIKLTPKITEQHFEALKSSDTFAEYKLKAAMAGEFKLVKPHVFKFIKGFNDWTNYRIWCEMLSVSYDTLERVPREVLNSAQLTTLS